MIHNLNMEIFSRIALAILCSLVCSVLILASIGSVHAQGAAAITAAIGTCSTYIDSNNRIFTPVVTCIQAVIAAASTSVMQQIANLLAESVVATMAIAMGILGVRVSLGATKTPHGDLFLLVVKISMISFLVLQTQVSFFLDILKSMVDAMTDVFTSVLDFSPTQVVQKPMDEDDAGTVTTAVITPPGGAEMWHRVDDIFQRVFGISGDDTQLAERVIGAILLIAGVINLGPIGGWVGVLVFFAFATLIGAFAMTIFVYIASQVAIMILAAFSPIIIPLLLFDNTRNIFENWMKQIISYSLQPLVLTAFLMFMLSIMQNSGPVDMITKYKDMYEGMTGPNSKSMISLVSSSLIQKNDSTVSTTGDVFDEVDSWKDFQRFVPGVGMVAETTPTTTKGTATVRIDVPVISGDNLDIGEFGINLLLMCFLGYIIISFINALPGIVTDLIGDRTVPNLVDRMGTPIFNAVIQGQQALGNYLRR